MLALEGLIRDLDGSIAQSVEQGIENPCVPGSIPGRATIKHLIRLGIFTKPFLFLRDRKIPINIIL